MRVAWVLHRERVYTVEERFNGMRNAGGAWEAAGNSGKPRMRNPGYMIYLRNSMCGMIVIGTRDLREVEEEEVEAEDVSIGIEIGDG
jgi:hypothetical protein